MTTIQMNLQNELDGKVVMLKAEFQQQLNAMKESIGDSLQAMKGQIAEVQQSQAKIWGAISRMGEELQGLAVRENDSDSEHEHRRRGPKTPRTYAPPTVAVWSPFTGDTSGCFGESSYTCRLPYIDRYRQQVQMITQAGRKRRFIHTSTRTLAAEQQTIPKPVR